MTDNISELVKRLRDVQTRERILGFGGSETLLLFSTEAADALEAQAAEIERLKRELSQVPDWRSGMTKRAEAEAEAERLKGALDRTGGFFVERTPELNAMFDDPAATTDVRQSMQQWIDHHNDRADKAETEVERLTAALNEIAGYADDRPGEWAAMHARKALEEK